MPIRPLKRCTGDSMCPELTRGGPCPAHTPKDDRPSAAARGYGVKWRRIRAAYLRAHPVCELAACDDVSVDVHHLDGRGPEGDNRWSNLQALCHRHHSQVTGASRR